LRIHRTASLASLTGMAASAAHRSQLLHSAGLLCGTHLTPFAPRRTVRSGLHASKARCFCTPRYAGAMPCSSSHCLGTRVLGHRPRALVPYAACARSAGSDVSCVARSARRGSSSRPSSPKPTAASASRRAPEPARATPGRTASDLRAAGGQQPVDGRQHCLRGAPRRPHPACRTDMTGLARRWRADAPGPAGTCEPDQGRSQCCAARGNWQVRICSSPTSVTLLRTCFAAASRFQCQRTVPWEYTL